MTPAARWADLKVRVASAAVLITLGLVEIYLGGGFFRVALVAMVALMVWELARLTSPSQVVAVGLAALAALCLWWAPGLGLLGWGLLLLPSLGFVLTPRRDPVLLAFYALACMVAGIGFLDLRDHGPGVFLWLVAIVVVSDTMGYFAGRTLGGPKFWPRVSPKKTWSGTIAGWIGAGVVLSPLIALAGQMGDILESWIKRRAGAKDSSRLIPGHGGVMDRFDALVGAVLALQVIGLFLAGPV